MRKDADGAVLNTDEYDLYSALRECPLKKARTLLYAGSSFDQRLLSKNLNFYLEDLSYMLTGENATVSDHQKKIIMHADAAIVLVAQDDVVHSFCSIINGLGFHKKIYFSVESFLSGNPFSHSSSETKAWKPSVYVKSKAVFRLSLENVIWIEHCDENFRMNFCLSSVAPARFDDLLGLGSSTSTCDKIARAICDCENCHEPFFLNLYSLEGDMFSLSLTLTCLTNASKNAVLSASSERSAVVSFSPASVMHVTKHLGAGGFTSGLDDGSVASFRSTCSATLAKLSEEESRSKKIRIERRDIVG